MRRPRKTGYAPCYHMLEIFKHPAHIKMWQAAADGQAVDWQAFMGDYSSGLDYPIAGFYQELMAAFPDAKVILTVRDPSWWYASTIETIYQGAIIPGWLLELLPQFRGMNRMIKATTWDRLFGGRFEDRDHAICVFEDHIAAVKQTGPTEKLLVFEVKDGWEPLCRFLDEPIPDEPFPHINDRQMTRRGYLLARVVAVALVLIALLILVVLAQAIL